MLALRSVCGGVMRNRSREEARWVGRYMYVGRKIGRYNVGR